MPSARQHAGDVYNMFGVSNLKKNQMEVVLTLVNISPAPKDFRAPFVAKIVSVADKDHVTINKSNTHKLIELLGDDYSEWCPAQVTFQRVEYDDFAPGLVVVAAKKVKGKVPF